MRRHSQRIRRIVIALIALCFIWLLSGQVVSTSAFAEGGGGPCPGEGLPADTTIITCSTEVPGSGTTTSDVIDVVVLFFSVVL